MNKVKRNTIIRNIQVINGYKWFGSLYQYPYPRKVVWVRNTMHRIKILLLQLALANCSKGRSLAVAIRIDNQC